MRNNKLEVVYVVIILLALLFMVGVLFYSPTGERVGEGALLPVKEGGFVHDQTVNPQLTADGSLLQQTADRETTEKFMKGEL